MDLSYTFKGKYDKSILTTLLLPPRGIERGLSIRSVCSYSKNPKLSIGMVSIGTSFPRLS